MTRPIGPLTHPRRRVAGDVDTDEVIAGAHLALLTQLEVAVYVGAMRDDQSCDVTLGRSNNGTNPSRRRTSVLSANELLEVRNEFVFDLEIPG